MVGVLARRGNGLGAAPMLTIVGRDHRHDACMVAIKFLPCQIELSIDAEKIWPAWRVIGIAYGHGFREAPAAIDGPGIKKALADTAACEPCGMNCSWLVCIGENHRIIRSMTHDFLIAPFTLRVSNRRLEAKARRKA